MKAPWDHPDVLYPPPHAVFLEMHYHTSIAMAMKANGDDYEPDGDDDYEKLSEPEEVQNEAVRIRLDGSLSGKEVTASRDFTVGDKGNIEVLTDIQALVRL